jgi:hypothetical protein
MVSAYDAPRTQAQLRVWWIIWTATLAGLGVVYFLLGRRPLGPPLAGANPFVNLIGFVPLFVSIVIRWLVLPRATDPKAAFVMFIIGLVLAEMCGFLGMFLGGPYREDLFILGVLGITQFVPLYARRLYLPKASGFIPNN